MLYLTWFCCPLISSLLAHFCAQPVLGSQLGPPWQLEHYNNSFSTLQCCGVADAEGKEGRLGAEVASPAPWLGRSSTEAKQIQLLLRWLGELQEPFSCSGSQPLEFSKQGGRAGFGSVPVVQPQPHEGAAQDCKASEGSQHDGQQHGRTSTWARREGIQQ